MFTDIELAERLRKASEFYQNVYLKHTPEQRAEYCKKFDKKDVKYSHNNTGYELERTDPELDRLKQERREELESYWRESMR